jgi:hypothetical protein
MSEDGYLDDVFDMDFVCGYPRGDCHCETDDDEDAGSVRPDEEPTP